MTTDGDEDVINWNRDDLPIFENGEVKVRAPELEHPSRNIGPDLSALITAPNFEASKISRLLHVLTDARMTAARAQLMMPRAQVELDGKALIPGRTI